MSTLLASHTPAISEAVPMDPNADLFDRHRLGLFMLGCFVCNTLVTTVRTCVPYLRKNFPLRAKYNYFDVAQLYMIIAVCCSMYYLCMENEAPRFAETWHLENRMSILVALMAVYTAVYYALQRWVVSALPEEHRAPQAANIIRIGVKTAMFVWWGVSGEFLSLLQTHPADLSQEKHHPTMVCMMAIHSLYLWEILYRDLRPVNIIHHGMACMGFVSCHEWVSVVQPIRTAIAMPIMGSLIEAFCCMGSVAYRFLPRGNMLSRILLAITVFVVVSYNFLLVAYLGVLYGYWEFFAAPWRYVAMPCTALFTYPAQMNMARMFYSLSVRSRSPHMSAVQPVETTTVVTREVVKKLTIRRQA